MSQRIPPMTTWVQSQFPCHPVFPIPNLRNYNQHVSKFTPHDGSGLPKKQHRQDDGPQDSPAFPVPQHQLLKCPRRSWTGSTAGFWCHSLPSTWIKAEGIKSLCLRVLIIHYRSLDPSCWLAVMGKSGNWPSDQRGLSLCDSRGFQRQLLPPVLITSELLGACCSPRCNHADVWSNTRKVRRSYASVEAADHPPSLAGTHRFRKGCKCRH